MKFTVGDYIIINYPGFDQDNHTVQKIVKINPSDYVITKPHGWASSNIEGGHAWHISKCFLIPATIHSICKYADIMNCNKKFLKEIVQQSLLENPKT